MGILSKEALLGASDLTEEEVELPSIGGSVRVRSLPAAYSNQATSEALKIVTGARGEQTSTIDNARLELLTVLHGLVEPKLNSLEEASQFAEKCGPAWHEVVRVINKISGVDKETVEKTNATFPAGGPDARGEDVGNGSAPGSS